MLSEAGREGPQRRLHRVVRFAGGAEGANVPRLVIRADPRRRLAALEGIGWPTDPGSVNQTPFRRELGLGGRASREQEQGQ